MKRFRIIEIIILCLCLFGCGADRLNYDGNLGFGFGKTKEVVFNAYHSNTENHTWEKIASFSITPKNG